MKMRKLLCLFGLHWGKIDYYHEGKNLCRYLLCSGCKKCHYRGRVNTEDTQDAR